MPAARVQIQNAIGRIQERRPIPEIDYTEHFLEDGTSVSTRERVVKDVRISRYNRRERLSIGRLSAFQVQAPPMNPPTNQQFFSREDRTKPDIAFLKNHFYREGRVTEEQALYIIEKGTTLLRAEPNLLEVDAPITGEWHN